MSAQFPALTAGRQNINIFDQEFESEEGVDAQEQAIV